MFHYDYCYMMGKEFAEFLKIFWDLVIWRLSFFEEFNILGLLFIASYIKFAKYSLREKCPNTEFFWSVFSRILTEYGEIRSRKNGPEKTQYLDTFHEVYFGIFKARWHNNCHLFIPCFSQIKINDYPDCLRSRHLLVQSQQLKHQNNTWNLFKS